MFKFVVLAALVAVASGAPGAGFLATPYVAAPYAVAHSVPVATSYANTYKVSVKSPAALIAAPASIAYATHAAAPLAYAAAPAYVHAAPLAYGYGAAAYIH